MEDGLIKQWSGWHQVKDNEVNGMDTVAFRYLNI